ncbi:hypothetical protein L1049_016202 [Liquidambar formosana]|uniref:F-box domain-containing protein n=1 Tax=Liquidambar formosana TaxID=63359 RepID=A0AAP0S5U5_LIQFO
MPVLPSEIIVDILARLPVKSLLRFKCACQSWRCSIADPYFVQKHLDRATKDANTHRHRLLLSTSPLQSVDFEVADEDEYEPVKLDFPLKMPQRKAEIVGSCNGLICLVVDSDSIILWNPSTRDAKELPKPYAITGGCQLNYGFGYDSCMGDYKVVRVARPATSSDFASTMVEIFSLKTSSWRRIQDVDPRIVLFGPGSPLNGVLHWFGEREIGQDLSSVIISFDLAAEKFQEVVQVPDPDVVTLSIRDFRVLGEYLSISCSDFEDYAEIWVMKEYGVKASWTRLVTLKSDTEPICEEWMAALWYSKNDEILIDMDGIILAMYNPKENTCRILLVDDDCGWLESFVYVESLVSPNVNDGTN